ncbi:MAG: hypothetical protein GW917_01200 [Bdellovibrionales bacterium]|nr:hypothetical protein [Bdellovibrionales bacterium]
MDTSRVQRILGRLDLWDRLQMRDFKPSEIETLEQALQILQGGKSLDEELLSELIHLEAQSESLTVNEKKPPQGNLQDPGVPKEMQFREPFWSEFPF